MVKETSSVSLACLVPQMVFLQQKQEPKAYCNSGSSSFCNSLSCLLAYTVKKIVVATVKEKPTTVKIICGAERPWCSCEASANVRIRIPLQQKQKKNLADKLKHIRLFEKSKQRAMSMRTIWEYR